MEEPKNAKLFLALKSRYALHTKQDVGIGGIRPHLGVYQGFQLADELDYQQTGTVQGSG